MTIHIEDKNVYLRGYQANQYRGQKAGLTTVEYRFQIRNLQVGCGNSPLFLKQLHRAAFGEAGEAWDDTFKRNDVKRAVPKQAWI